jgi:hypothetical protein
VPIYSFLRRSNDASFHFPYRHRGNVQESCREGFEPAEISANIAERIIFGITCIQQLP